MASLTVGGQVYEIRLSATDIGDAEHESMKRGGRPIMALFLPPYAGYFGKHEVDWLLWAAWRHRLTPDRIRAVVEQFFADGGSFMDVHREVLEAVMDSGLYGRRQTNGLGPPADPPPAGTSA